MSQKLDTSPAVVGIDIGKNSFHIVGQNQRGAIVLRQKWSRGQVEARFANLPPCRIGMEACVGAHHLSRKLQMLGHDARLMPGQNGSGLVGTAIQRHIGTTMHAGRAGTRTLDSQSTGRR